MEEKKKSKKVGWIIGIIILLIILITFLIINFNKKDTLSVNSNNKISKNIKTFEFGDMIVLDNNDKEELRNMTIQHIKERLKTPSIAEFEEEFEYICDESNIVKVRGYVDSQNGFGAMLRSDFECEYFIVYTIMDSLVYLKLNDEEMFNIKEELIEDYKKQLELDNLNSSGKELNQEKLEYIMNEFNNEEWTSAGKITMANFEKNVSNIDIQITVKNIEKKEDKQYWIYYNIIGIIDYIKEFDKIGTVKVKLYIGDVQVAYAEFDENFLTNIWKDNQLIPEVPKLFGENYKEMF